MFVFFCSPCHHMSSPSSTVLEKKVGDEEVLRLLSRIDTCLSRRVDGAVSSAFDELDARMRAVEEREARVAEREAALLLLLDEEKEEDVENGKNKAVGRKTSGVDVGCQAGQGDTDRLLWNQAFNVYHELRLALDEARTVHAAMAFTIAGVKCVQCHHLQEECSQLLRDKGLLERRVRGLETRISDDDANRMRLALVESGRQLCMNELSLLQAMISIPPVQVPDSVVDGEACVAKQSKEKIEQMAIRATAITINRLLMSRSSQFRSGQGVPEIVSTTVKIGDMKVTELQNVVFNMATISTKLQTEYAKRNEVLKTVIEEYESVRKYFGLMCELFATALKRVGECSDLRYMCVMRVLLDRSHHDIKSGWFPGCGGLDAGGLAVGLENFVEDPENQARIEKMMEAEMFKVMGFTAVEEEKLLGILDSFRQVVMKDKTTGL